MRALIVLLAALGALAAVIAAAVSAQTTATPRIYACAAKSNGALRIVAAQTRCHASDTAWTIYAICSA